MLRPLPDEDVFLLAYGEISGSYTAIGEAFAYSYDEIIASFSAQNVEREEFDPATVPDSVRDEILADLTKSYDLLAEEKTAILNEITELLAEFQTEKTDSEEIIASSREDVSDSVERDKNKLAEEVRKVEDAISDLLKRTQTQVTTAFTDIQSGMEESKERLLASLATQELAHREYFQKGELYREQFAEALQEADVQYFALYLEVLENSDLDYERFVEDWGRIETAWYNNNVFIYTTAIAWGIFEGVLTGGLAGAFTGGTVGGILGGAPGAAIGIISGAIGGAIGGALSGMMTGIRIANESYTTFDAFWNTVGRVYETAIIGGIISGLTGGFLGAMGSTSFSAGAPLLATAGGPSFSTVIAVTITQAPVLATTTVTSIVGMGANAVLMQGTPGDGASDAPSQKDVEKFKRKHNLGGKWDTEKNLFIYNNRNMTVRDYVGKYRKGSINEVMPEEAYDMTVQEVLKAGKVNGVNVRKLLINMRDKFLK